MIPAIVSQALRRSAPGHPCTLRTPLCNNDDRTVVLAHVYTGPKATAGKGHDLHAVLACSCCHDVLDRRVRCRAWEPMRDRETLRAMIETQSIWIADGLIVVIDALPKASRPLKQLPKLLPRTEWRP